MSASTQRATDCDAEFNESELESRTGLANTRSAVRGRRSRFTAEEDLIIVREVAAAKAHVAPYGDIRARFEIAAARASENERMGAELNAKSVHDRYVKLQRAFDKKDKEAQRMSGIEEEVTELDEILAQLREERDDCENRKQNQKYREKQCNDIKEFLGAEIRDLALKRSGSRDTDKLSSGESSHAVKKRKTASDSLQGSIPDLLDSDPDVRSFEELLKTSERDRISVERERLAVERQKLDFDQEQRRLEREDRIKQVEIDREIRKREREEEFTERERERESRERLELEKFKIMMSVFRREQPQ
jgi:hypothetical protein